MGKEKREFLSVNELTKRLYGDITDENVKIVNMLINNFHSRSVTIVKDLAKSISDKDKYRR